MLAVELQKLDHILVVQTNLSSSYEVLGREEEAISLREDVYSGRLKLNGKEHKQTLVAALNYADSLCGLERFEEAKTLLRKTIPVARRVLGDSVDTTLRTRWLYARALFGDAAASLDDLREAVTTLEDLERTSRRVFGGAHPLSTIMEDSLREARATLRTRETPPESS